MCGLKAKKMYFCAGKMQGEGSDEKTSVSLSAYGIWATSPTFIIIFATINFDILVILNQTKIKKINWRCEELNPKPLRSVT